LISIRVNSFTLQQIALSIVICAVSLRKIGFWTARSLLSRTIWIPNSSAQQWILLESLILARCIE